jgi:hypothetical protein
MHRAHDDETATPDNGGDVEHAGFVHPNDGFESCAPRWRTRRHELPSDVEHDRAPDECREQEAQPDDRSLERAQHQRR